MRAAVDAGMIARTPCRGVPLPRIQREEMRFLAPAAIHRLTQAMHPRYRALVLVASYGGLRIGELAALRRTAIDLALGTVRVVETLSECRGIHEFGPPKTRAGRRTVGLPSIVVEELADHM